MLRRLLLALALAAPAHAQTPGDFDYYVLALSWEPTHCAGEGRGRAECNRVDRWVLHGLWPQYEDGWPDWCEGGGRDPSRAESGGMADLMGSGGAAWYQWRKHGRCSGLNGRDYYALARDAYDRVTMPPALERLDRDLRLPARVVEQAFLEANPDWSSDMLTITCRDGRIHEARLCLTRDLAPRICGADVRRDCRARDALMPAP